MANSSTSNGALQRSGVKRLITDKRGKAREAFEGGPGSGPRKGSGKKDKTQGGKYGPSGRLTAKEQQKMYRKSDKEYMEKTGRLPGGGHSERSRSMKKESRQRESIVHIREAASHNAFTEKGEDEKQKGQKSGQTAKSRVYLVTIIEEGLGNSKDKNYYSAEALQSGPSVFNGAKAFCDHPDAISEKTLPERSMRDVVGWYTDCFTDKNPQTGKVRLRGKLHIFPDAKWLSDKIDTILTDPTAKNLFGISINAIGKTRPSTMDGEEVNYVEQFQRVDSADVVTEPAARGKFDQMLESRRSSKSKVSVNMSTRTRRTREAAALSSEKAKEVADSLVSAYNSDNPDEAKQAMFEASKILHAAASISGKGPGQSNEEQYSNINPSGGSDSTGGNPSGGAQDMKNRNVKASGRRPLGFRKKKALRAAAGKGPDNEDEGEPEPSDIEPKLESRRRSSREADVEDEEDDKDYGEVDDFGGGGKHHAKEAFEEGFEDEDMEGMEDEGMEDEDENVGQAPGGAATPGTQPGAAAPAGGGAPGSSRSIASAEADDGESDENGDSDSDDDLDNMDEADEDEDMMRPGSVSESGRRRRRSSREANASFSGGGLGKSGHAALPKGVDETKGYNERDEDWGKEDDSTSGVGKSYKIKTSRFARNRKARHIVKPVVREANRRIEFLTEKLRRLTESNRSKERKVEHYRGKVRLMESSRTATSLLREAVKKEILPGGVADNLYRELIGLDRDDQIRKIKSTALFLESAQEGAAARLMESVDGNGARGGVVSWGTAGAEDSELVEALANDGVPMREEE